MRRGVVYVAYGEPARHEAAESIKTLRRFHPNLPICALGEPVAGTYTLQLKQSDLTPVQRSRWTKANLHNLSPFERTLYIDADTRIHGSLAVGFDILADGFDLVITASDHQGAEVMWHIGAEEREATLDDLAHVPVALQGGIMWVQKNERTTAFFTEWRRQWRRWEDQDQAALLRALRRVPLRVWILGKPFSNGAVVAHKFGRARS